MKNRGFTLIELLVVIAIIALLLAIIMPALGKVKEIAIRLVDRNNVRQVALGATLYAEDNDNLVPNPGVVGAWLWDINFRSTNAMSEYAGFEDDSDIFFCPANKQKKAGDARTWQYRWVETLSPTPPIPLPARPYTSELPIMDESGLSDAYLRSLYRVPSYIYMFDKYPETSSEATATGKNIGESILNALVTGEEPKWVRKTSNVKNAGATTMLIDAVISDGTKYFDITEGGIGGFTNLTDNSNHKSNKTTATAKNPLPSGGNVSYVDGHAEWRMFDDMQHRYTSGKIRFFW